MHVTSRGRFAVLALMLASAAILIGGCGDDDTATPELTPPLASPTATELPEPATPAGSVTPDPGASQTLAVTPSPTATTPDPSPTSTPELVPVEQLTWQWLPAPGNGLRTDLSTTGVFHIGDQLIVTGYVSDDSDTDGAMFVSSDGITWEPIVEAAFSGPTEEALAAVAPGGPGLVAAGTEILLDGNGDQINDPIIWVSADGLDWERVSDPGLTAAGRQEVFTVIATPVGLVASGWGVDDLDVRDEDFMVWLSADGRDWERITTGLEAPGSQRVGLDPEFNRHSATGRGTIVIVGRQQLLGEPDLLPAIWVTVNGTSWEPAAGVPLSQPGELNSVTANDELFVAVGTDGSDALVLISTDGYNWERVARDALNAPGTQRMSGIEPYGDGFIGVGYIQENDETFHAVWTSPDGRSWQLLNEATTTRAPAPGQHLAYMAQTGTGLVIMSQAGDPHILIGQPQPTP